MQHREQVRILSELLRQLERHRDADAGRIVENPTDVYTSAALAREEWRLMFREHPQLIGLTGDIPQPGDYMTVDEFGVPVLAVRSGDGKFRAFINACRHRGARIASEARGNTKRFACPFHGWTYSNSGELAAISEPQNFGDVDRTCLGLIELPAVEIYGMLWIHPQVGGALNVADLLGELAPEIDEWHLSDRIFKGSNALNKAMNWKLANDTFGENYHFSRLHKNTLNNLAIGDAHVYDAFGPHHRMVFASRGVDKLRSKPQDKWRIDNATTVLYYLFPNIQITMSERQIAMFRIYPEAGNPGRCNVNVSHYFSAEALGLIESGAKTVIDEENVYDRNARNGNAIVSPAAAMEVINSTLENEDFLMAEMTQKSVESGAIEKLIFGRNEPALHHFHHTFRSVLNLSPLKELQQTN